MNKFILMALSLSLTMWRVDLLAYDNTVTHRIMTTAAIQYSALKTDNYLTARLGNFFNLGINTNIQDQRIKHWIQDGADFEDRDPIEGNACRANNHFHNPIKGWQNGVILGWDQAQKTDDSLSFIATNLEAHCRHFGWEPETRKSQLVWATEFLEPVAGGAQKIDLQKQDWSWTDARKYFYEALTLSASDAREIAYTNTFRAIGQVMHLIQDAAQPAHVRNDFQSHLVVTHIGFESPFDWIGSPYEYYVKMRPTLVERAIPIRPNIENASLTDFWDTNTYDGTVQLSGLNLGLAEYANANYFSEETIPNNVTSFWQLNRAGQIREHLFPYPKLNEDDYEICKVPVSTDALKVFIARKSRGGCESDDHMAQLSLIDTSAKVDIPSVPKFNIAKAYMTMDNAVYKTYAKELLPLAIGYSSALIDYFFRGRLGVIKKYNGLVIKNIGNEVMSAYTDEENKSIGKIEIFYDRPDGNRQLLAEHSLAQPLDAGAQTPLIHFTSPTDNITPDRYIVVFKGKLGKEEGAVMARVVSPKIYYVAQQDKDGQLLRKIMRMEADGQYKTVVFDNADPNFNIGTVAISPDASTLAFNGSHADGPVFIYTLDISEGWNETPKQLTEGYWPDWSPDGNKLVFQKGLDSLNGSTRAQVFSYDINTETQTLLAGGSNRSDSQPAWSPDQERIAYVTNAEDEVPNFEPGPGEIECGNNDRSIELMNPSGLHSGSGTVCLNTYYSVPDVSGVTTFGARVGNIHQPVWHPDGNKIMYLGTFKFPNPAYTPEGNQFRYINVTKQPFKININTQEETALFDINKETNFRYFGVSSWSLDGETIAATRMGMADGLLSLSKSHIVIIDATTGNDVQGLTELGRFHPDFGY